MLAVIPNLASADELTTRLDALKTRTADNTNPPGTDEIVDLFDSIQSRIDSLLENRKTIRESSAHPKLLENLDKYIGILFCRNLHDTMGLIAQYSGVGTREHQSAQCKDYQMKVKLKEINFSRESAPCLPPGDPVKPAGCR